MNQLNIVILKGLRRLYLSLCKKVDWHLKPYDSLYDAQSTSDKIRDLLRATNHV